jgi:hypothetical protein
MYTTIIVTGLSVYDWFAWDLTIHNASIQAASS